MKEETNRLYRSHASSTNDSYQGLLQSSIVSLVLSLFVGQLYCYIDCYFDSLCTVDGHLPVLCKPVLSPTLVSSRATQMLV